MAARKVLRKGRSLADMSAEWRVVLLGQMSVADLVASSACWLVGKWGTAMAVDLVDNSAYT